LSLGYGVGGDRFAEIAGLPAEAGTILFGVGATRIPKS
jgi:hypothetical protein